MTTPAMLDRAQAVTIEEHVLGEVMLYGKGFEHLRGMTEEVFTSIARREIYGSMCRLDASGTPPDFMTIQDDLETHVGKSRDRSVYLSKITNGHEGTSIPAARKILLSRLSSRTLFDTLTSLTAEMEAGEHVDEVAVRMLRAAQEALPSTGTTCGVGELFDSLEEYQRGDTPAYLSFGISEIDDGFPVGTDELVVIGAQSSVGKTALSMSMANALTMRGFKCLYITMESSAREIMYRRLSLMADVPTSAMKRAGGLSGGQYDRIGTKCDVMKHNPVIVMGGRFSSIELCTEIRAAKIEHDISAVFIDHIGKVSLPGTGQHRHELGQITADLAGVAKELGVAVFALSQLNRQVAAREDKRPVISDIRDSGEIEQDADIIWLLHRPGRHQDDPDNVLEVMVAKNRNGRLGSVKLEFIAESCGVRERGVY